MPDRDLLHQQSGERCLAGLVPRASPGEQPAASGLYFQQELGQNGRCQQI